MTGLSGTKGRALRRVTPAAATLVAAAGAAGCMQVTEVSTISANGSSTTTMVIAFSPKLGPSLASVATTLGSSFGTKLSPAQVKQLAQQVTLEEAKLLSDLRQQAKDHKLPGRASVAPYTNKQGWKGLKVSFTLPTLAALQRLATSGTGGSAPQFSTFSVTSHNGVWAMSAKFNTSSVGAAAGSSAPGAPQGQAGATLTKALEKLGMSYVVSFKFPGRPVSDNATSRAANGTLSWDLLKGPSTLQARWSSQA